MRIELSSSYNAVFPPVYPLERSSSRMRDPLNLFTLSISNITSLNGSSFPVVEDSLWYEGASLFSNALFTVCGLICTKRDIARKLIEGSFALRVLIVTQSSPEGMDATLLSPFCSSWFDCFLGLPRGNIYVIVANRCAIFRRKCVQFSSGKNIKSTT